MVIARIAIACIVVACSPPAKPQISNQVPQRPEPPAVVAFTSPGPLATVHQAVDDPARCNDCHVNGTKAIDSNKCLGCHDHGDLRARISAGKGFHASAGVRGKSCGTCHKDHKGKHFDLRGWSSVKGGEQSFDHDLTGWRLDGKHATTSCDQCHKARNSQGLTVYMGTDRLCGSAGCHAQDQPHKLARRDLLACERCHTAAVWKPAKSAMQFDHNDRKDAAMPIALAHATVTCAKCHPKAEFALGRAPADGCDGCHKSPHGGHAFAQKPCATCHSPTQKKFKQVVIDHAEVGRISLAAHAKVRCYDCHTVTTPPSVRPPKPCAACHSGAQPPSRKVSRHADRFKQFGSPPACETCHPATSWRPTRFDHRQQTGFPLHGKHAESQCRSCHRGKTPADFEDFKGNTTCTGCHAHAKVHDSKYTDQQCLQCHVAPGPPPRPIAGMSQIHGPTGTFPLVEGHRAVPCADCHTARGPGGKITFTSVDPECSGCHTDPHMGRRGKKCSGCHPSGSWTVTGSGSAP